MKKKGISLIILVITIIVIIILATAVITNIDNNIIEKAGEATEGANYNTLLENLKIVVITEMINKDWSIITIVNEIENNIENSNVINAMGGDIELNTYQLKVTITKDNKQYEFSVFNDGKVEKFNGVIFVLSEQEASIQGFTWDTTSNSLTGYTGNSAQVIIPNKIGNMEVKNIGDNAFERCTITKIVIPNSVNTIGQNCFLHCDALTDITIPSSVNAIGQQAFFSCDSLVNIIIPDNVTTVEQFTFKDCIKLKSIVLSNNITSIGDYAFCNCYALNDVTIPSSVTTIGNYALYRCYALNEITILSSVINMETNVFGGWTNTQSINVYWSQGSKPNGWNEGWLNGCNAIVNYL